MHPAGRFGVGFSERLPERLGRSAEVAPNVSYELSNYCGADRQPTVDGPGSFGAPSRAIDDHLTCFGTKTSLVRPERRVLLSPVARTERHTSMYGGTGGTAVARPSRVHVVPAQRPQLFRPCAGQE